MHTIDLSFPSKQNRIPFVLSLVILLGVSFLCHDSLLFSYVTAGSTGLEFLPGFLNSPALWITLGWIPVVWLTMGKAELLKLVGLLLLAAPLPALGQALFHDRFQSHLLENLAFNHAWILGFHLVIPLGGLLAVRGMVRLMKSGN